MRSTNSAGEAGNDRMAENFLTHANNEQRRWQQQEQGKEEKKKQREDQFQRISIVDSGRTRVFIVREALAWYVWYIELYIQFTYALRIIPTTIGSMHTYIQSIQYIQYISSSAQVIRIEVSIVRQRARCEFSWNTRAVVVAVTVDVSVAVDVAVAVTMASILYTGYRSFLPVPEAHLIPGNLVFKCCV